MEDINGLKVADLRRELKDRGLPHTGTKNELVSRLQEALSTEKPTSDDSVIDEALLDENSLLGEDDDSNSGGEDVDTSSDNENTNGVDTTSSLTKSPSKSPISSPKKSAVAKDSAAAAVATAPAIPSAIRTASPEKKRTGTTVEAEDGESTAKKLKINREPIQPPAAKAADGPKSATESISAPISKSVSSVVAPPEENAAVKLNPTTLSLAERAKLRQQKFGSSEEAKPEVANGKEPEKLNKRAARFGSTLSTPAGGTAKASGPVSADELGRLAKRRERFGKELAETKETAENAKQKRAQRFGGAAATTTGTAVTATAVSKDGDEKKKTRAARFGI